MTPIDWLRKQFLAEPAHSWAEGCPAGLPVPGAERCAAADCESVPLTALAEGERGRVTCLEQPGSPAARVNALVLNETTVPSQPFARCAVAVIT